MAISGWLVHGVQGSAHAINEAGSLRMQSYRLLAAVPLTQDDQKLLDEMERTVFSPELECRRRDGQQASLKRSAVLAAGAGAGDETGAESGYRRDGRRGFVDRIDRWSPLSITTEQRIERGDGSA
jgi:two-component system nitrate/nitrite sensor histidine kinase NarX